MTKLAVIGAGAMGLAAAYHALEKGHKVEIFEAGRIAGGMAAHFDFGGYSLERYYHFICKSDHPTFELLDELNISDKLKWVDTKMGYYINGKLYNWGNPMALLKFPLMNMLEKFRYGLKTFLLTKKKEFVHIESLTAKEWIIRDYGQKNYDLMWKRLFELKFYEYTNQISASWIATRIKRIGNSRRSILQETLGYLEGGSETLVKALDKWITAHGGKIHLSSPVEQVLTEDGRVKGIKCNGKEHYFDAIISTVPIPLVSKMIPDLTKKEKEQYKSIHNIGVVCLALKLRKSVTPNFWLNINDSTINIPGIIEFSNLRPCSEHIVYVPYYLPINNPKFKMSDEEFITLSYQYIQKINPSLTESDIIDANVSRLIYSQPVCGPNFLSKLPDIQTSIAGLQVADTCYYYPEDRGIAESVRLGKRMAGYI